MNTQFISAIEQICEEKGLSKDIVLETVEHALIAAYKKDYGDKDQEVRVELDNDSGEVRIFVTKEVAKEVENPFLQITKDQAQVYKKSAKIGDEVEYEEVNKDFGRVAAQTAKQVIIQRIREAERDVVFTEYQDKVDTILNGVVQRVEGNNVYIDLGKAVGIMFANEQIHHEHCYAGQRLKVYVVRVEQTARGPQVVVSRAHPNMIKKLFEMEVPEMATGTVEIVNVAREAGNRTKLAVKSNVEGVDAVGTFVGGRGTRVQAVMADLGEEKIDIIPYSEDPKVYIASALSPTKVINVKIDEENKKALVRVPEDQLSLAIGKQGQNVRLAAKLTGWNVDIDGADEAGVEETAQAVEEQPKKEKVNLEDSIIAATEEQNEAGSVPDEAAESETDQKTTAESGTAPAPAEDTKDEAAK